VKGNNGKKDEIPEDTLTNLGEMAKEHCHSYCTSVWFELGKELMCWIRHQTKQQEEHICHYEIIKPFKMARRDFSNQVTKMHSNQAY
jgi:hypothetical protein